jgi:hypothetical protein
MLRTRKVYLLKDDAFTAARTKVQDVNIIDPISSIDIIVEMTNGSGMTESSVVKPHNEFTKIELVDGSDVIVSASMQELQALNAYSEREMPYMDLTLDSSAVQREMCSIHFGLGLNDPKHYFNPKKFRNPQLRITNTLTTPAATAWASSGHYLTVIANIIEEGAQAQEGYFMTKEIYSYTAVDGAVETLDMPRDYAYRLLLLQALKTGYSPTSSLEKIKLSCDADKFIPIDMDIDHLMFEIVSRFGPFVQALKKRVTGAATIYADLYHLVRASLEMETTLHTADVLSISGEAISMEDVLQGATDAVSTAEALCDAVVQGYAPHSCILLPFGRMDVPEDWFDPTKFGDIDLKLTGESAAGTINVVLQQLRK